MVSSDNSEIVRVREFVQVLEGDTCLFRSG
jgi:hypothetical protein